jgi:hypothetical protein
MDLNFLLTVRISIARFSVLSIKQNSMHRNINSFGRLAQSIKAADMMVQAACFINEKKVDCI